MVLKLENVAVLQFLEIWEIILKSLKASGEIFICSLVFKHKILTLYLEIFLWYY